MSAEDRGMILKPVKRGIQDELASRSNVGMQSPATEIVQPARSVALNVGASCETSTTIVRRPQER